MLSHAFFLSSRSPPGTPLTQCEERRPRGTQRGWAAGLVGARGACGFSAEAEGGAGSGHLDLDGGRGSGGRVFALILTAPPLRGRRGQELRAAGCAPPP